MHGLVEREISVVRTTFCVKSPYLLGFENVVRTTFAKLSALDPQNNPECDHICPILGQANPRFGTVLFDPFSSSECVGLQREINGICTK